MDTRIALLVREGEIGKKYADRVASLGALAHLVSSFPELYATLKTAPYNGVIVDLLMKIKAPEEDKESFLEVLDNFPVLQLNYDHNTGEIRAFYFSQFKGVSSLEDFVTQECGAFKPRLMRSNVRKKIHLNALLTKATDRSDGAAEKTVTIDISPGGCFLFSTQPWDLKDRVEIVMKELSDQTPILGETRWKRDWGESKDLPGIGVKFIRITDQQLEEIRALL